jgi:signal recognition particle subunit SRP54
MDVAFLPIIQGQDAPTIAKRALQSADLKNRDVVILDTAGRTSIDEELMGELSEITKIAKPSETLLVADSLTGQDAVETAKRFQERIALTGLVLTRADGDGRGGAILSMRAITGKPVKFLGVGERPEDLEAFDARRVAGRILGMGDVVGLVERAQESMEQEQAEVMAEKMAKGQFDLDDLAAQLKQMQKMGGFASVLGMLPGMGGMGKAMKGANVDEGELKRQESVIYSMTKAERRDPRLMNASRKRRVARGAGVDVADVNKILKMHRQMGDMMKTMGGKGMKEMAAAMAGGGGGQGGGGAGPSLPGLGGPAGMGGLGGMGGLPPGALPGQPAQRGRKATKKKPKPRRKK